MLPGGCWVYVAKAADGSRKVVAGSAAHVEARTISHRYDPSGRLTHVTFRKLTRSRRPLLRAEACKIDCIVGDFRAPSGGVSYWLHHVRGEPLSATRAEPGEAAASRKALLVRVVVLEAEQERLPRRGPG